MPSVCCVERSALTEVDAVLFKDRVQHVSDGRQMLAYGRARIAILARLELTLFIP
eukprot:SAG31_NODE_45202_length_259_cov_1.831250_1_plen_54_part_01